MNSSPLHLCLLTVPCVISIVVQSYDNIAANRKNSVQTVLSMHFLHALDSSTHHLRGITVLSLVRGLK